MSSKTLSSEMVSKWSIREVADWFYENGFACACGYIKQHKINGQKLLSKSSQTQAEMFGMNAEQTREMLTKLNRIGVYNNLPSDDSFDDFDEYSQSDFEEVPDRHMDSQPKICGYLDPDMYEQTDRSSHNGIPISRPPTLPPRAVPPGKKTGYVTSEDSDYEKVDGPEDELNFPKTPPDISFPHVLKNLPPAKHEPKFPSSSPPLPKTKPPELPPLRNEACRQPFNTQTKDIEIESDGLPYEIGGESHNDLLNQPPSLPPRPKGSAPLTDPEKQKQVRFPQGVPISAPEHSHEQITPPKFQPPCVPGMLKIDIEIINQKRNQLKSRATKGDATISETPTSKPPKPPFILEPKSSQTVVNGPNGGIGRAPASRPPEKPNIEKKAIILIPQSNAILKKKALTKNSLEDEKWFQNITREVATRTLEDISKNGAFIVRSSSRKVDKPYTLVVYLDGKVLNIPIRKRSDNKFALGSEKPNEEAFESVIKLVAYHSNTKIDVSTPAGNRGVTLVNALNK